MHIVILTSEFIDWGGGIDFIRICLNGLNNVKAKGLQISILIPEKNTLKERVLVELRPYKRILLDFLTGKKIHFYKKKHFEKETIISSFKEFNDFEIVFFKDNYEDLVRTLNKIKANVVLPSAKSLGANFPIPWVGYIYDFQYKYFPEFFTTKELVLREQSFHKMLSEAKAVIVNSEAVRNDIYKYFSNKQSRVFNLPFSPILSKIARDNNGDAIKKYNLPPKFFIISNQFWKHKSHITAFKALSLLASQKAFAEVFIVCTGKEYDDRFPQYFKSLKEEIKELGIDEKIIFLGYIPKEDQIDLMNTSLGVLQPTLFEGGPGGGAIYDAISHGIPAIISDIQVNKEIDSPNILFFKAGSAEDMAEKMKQLLLMKKLNREELMDDLTVRSMKLGEKILEAADFVSNRIK